jgi:hypothetical protein
MFCIVPAVRVHILCCASGKCTCFVSSQRYVYVFCVVPVVRVHVVCCASGTCTCFVLYQWYVYIFCIVPAVRQEKFGKHCLTVPAVLCPSTSNKIKLRTVCLTWCCIDNVTRQNILHDSDSLLSSQEIKSVMEPFCS